MKGCSIIKLRCLMSHTTMYSKRSFINGSMCTNSCIYCFSEKGWTRMLPLKKNYVFFINGRFI